ncbi:unnamed protein product, partial [marine sediment metagenome]
RLIVEGIQDSLDRSLSPVAGGRFKTLTAENERSILFEEGDLRESIKSVNRQGDNIEVGVWKPSEKLKAYNHNIGDTVPTRQFIPGEDQSFKKKVMSRVDRRIAELKRGQKDTRVKELETTTLDRLFQEATGAASGEQTSSDSTFSFTIGDLLAVFDGE